MTSPLTALNKGTRAGAHAAERRVRGFYAGMAAAAIIAVFAGFAPPLTEARY